MSLSDFENDFADESFDDFEDLQLDEEEIGALLNAFIPVTKKKPEPKKTIEEKEAEKVEEKKVKKNKKPKKWNKVAKILMEKGLLQNNIYNFIDYITFELNIPSQTDIVVKKFSCGFFDWTFSFFFNNHSHREKFFDSVQAAFKKLTIVKSKKFRKNLRKHLLKKRSKKAKKRNDITGGFISGSSRKLVQWKNKKNFMLFAECHPNSICSTDIHGHNIYEWSVISSFKTVWKGSKRDNGSINGIKKPSVFTSFLPSAPIRSYGKKCSTKNQTLIVHMWVNKIRALRLIPPLIFDKELPNNQSVCLKCSDEYFHVDKSNLAMYSSVFNNNILNEGLGNDLKNPIKISEKFKPSQVRLALKAIFEHNVRIPCVEVVKLLDFAYEYKILAILNKIEDSLINSRKCIHFNFQQKIDLAYKYGLDELKNNFCKLNNSIESIEKNLNNEALHPQFKDQLKRKLACMKAAEAAGMARISEKKEERTKKRKANKLNKKEAKKAARVEGS